VQLAGTGIWAHQLRYGDAGAIADLAAELDELGYDALWIPDVGGDVLGSVDLLLRAAPRAAVATGVLNIWMHEPANVAEHIGKWDHAWRSRFVLGLGVSHAALIDHGNPGRYTKPYSKMFEYLDGLDAAHPPCTADQRVLAALGPRMLELARDRAAGAHPYFVPPEHVAAARARLNPTSLIAVEQAVVLDTDPSSARATARRHTAIYTTLPNYTNNLRRFGYDDADFADAGSDRLVDAIVAWGDLDGIAARVQLMRDAGADHVCVQVVRADDETPRADWRELAAALIGR
jgi:probable F420-dependent oxidoreductase